MQTKANQLPGSLVEVGQFFEPGYKPILVFDGWRVAVLRFTEDAAPKYFYRVERHRNTTEVFILTAGATDLILCDGDQTPGKFYVTPMVLNVAYNVRPSVWHQVVMSADAHIILFERDDTGPATTDYATLDNNTIAQIQGLFSLNALSVGK